MGLTSLNRPHSGGGQLVWGPIPMQPAASLPQTEGREETESEEEGQQQKDREGAQRETTEMEKKKRESAHNRERMLGPKASKVAKGEK